MEQITKMKTLNHILGCEARFLEFTEIIFPNVRI